MASAVTSSGGMPLSLFGSYVDFFLLLLLVCVFETFTDAA